MWYSIEGRGYIVGYQVNELALELGSMGEIHHHREMVFRTEGSSVGVLARKQFGLNLMYDPVVYYLL